MPTYDTATVAFAVSAPRKWVDNTCTQFSVPGVQSVRQGVSRQFSFEGVVALQLIRGLCVEFSLPAREAVRLATALLADGRAMATAAHGIVIGLDLDALTHQVQQRLFEAVESVPRVRRGRPPSLRDSTGAMA